MQVTSLRPSRCATRTTASAVLSPVEALDLPDVGLDAGVLELADRCHHQRWAQRAVVGQSVALHERELRRFGRHQQLEQEPPPASARRYSESCSQPPGLAPIQRRIASGL